MQEKHEATKAKLTSKNTKAAREALLKQVKGKVRNYIRKENDDDDVQKEIEMNTE